MKRDMDWDDYVGQRLSLRQAIAIGSGLGFLVALLILAAAFMLLGGLLAHKAHAQTRQCVEWGYRIVRSQEWPHERTWRQRYCARHAYVDSYRRYYAAPKNDDEENSWNRRDPREERGVSCLRHPDGRPFEVRVVGRARLSEKAALDDAVGGWQGHVAYDHGEKLMEISDARNYRWRCNRASSNQSLIGRVGEAAVGDAAVQKKCAVIAQPCLPPMKDGAKDDKDER